MNPDNLHGGVRSPERWQRNASKDGWFKLGPNGLVDVSDVELRAFEKANHADLRGVSAQGRLDLLLAARA